MARSAFHPGRLSLVLCGFPLVAGAALSLTTCGGEPTGPRDPFEGLALTASPASGPPPLTVSFDVTVPASARAERVDLDADGDGTSERTGSKPEDVEGPGVFGERGTHVARLRVTGRSGQSAEATAVIIVTEGGVSLVGRQQFFGLEAPAISPDGSLLYLADRDNLIVADAGTLAQLDYIVVDVGAHKVLVTRDGTKAYLWDAEHTGFPFYGTAIVDLGLRKQVGRLSGGFKFADLAPDGGTLFMPANPADFSGPRLEARRTATDELAGTVELPGPPEWLDLAPGVPHGVVLIGKQPTAATLRLALFDPTSLTVTQTVPLPGIQSALWAALRPGTSEVYILADAASASRPGRRGPNGPRLVVLQVPGGIESQIRLPAAPTDEFGELTPYEWSADGRFLYVAGEGGLFVVDAGTRAVVARVPPQVAEGCDVVLHPALPRLFLTDYDGALSVFELSGFPPR